MFQDMGVLVLLSENMRCENVLDMPVERYNISSSF
jgi:hypothetical protein